MAVLPALRLRHPEVWCFTWRNCIIYFWQRITVEGMRTCHGVTQEMRQLFPQGLVTVSYTMPGGPLLPSSEARAEALRLMNEMRGVFRATAAVNEAPGLVMAAARTFLSALTIAANRSEQRFRLFSSLDRVPPWLAPFMCPDGYDRAFLDELGESLTRARTIRGGESRPTERPAAGMKV